MRRSPHAAHSRTKRRRRGDDRASLDGGPAERSRDARRRIHRRRHAGAARARRARRRRPSRRPLRRPLRHRVRGAGRLDPPPVRRGARWRSDLRARGSRQQGLGRCNARCPRCDRRERDGARRTAVLHVRLRRRARLSRRGTDERPERGVAHRHDLLRGGDVERAHRDRLSGDFDVEDHGDRANRAPDRARTRRQRRGEDGDARPGRRGRAARPPARHLALVRAARDDECHPDATGWRLVNPGDLRRRSLDPFTDWCRPQRRARRHRRVPACARGRRRPRASPSGPATSSARMRSTRRSPSARSPRRRASTPMRRSSSSRRCAMSTSSARA